MPVWQAHSPEITKNGPVAQEYAQLAIDWYQHLFEFRTRVDPARYFCIDYRELVRDPRATIERLYAHFGWEMSAACREKLGQATERQRDFKSKHEYTLEEFGMTREGIQAQLGGLLDFYRLER